MLKTGLKVVVTDYEFPSVSIEREILKEIGANLIEGHCKTEDDVIAIASDADVVINQYTPITEGIIKHFKKCKAIIHYGIGVNNVDIKAATKREIYVVTIPDYCVDDVSTHAVTLILTCLRKVVFLNNALKQDGKWDFNLAKPIRRLSSLTLGIVGFGKIGRSLAKKAKGFEFRSILAYDPYVSINAKEEYNEVKMVDITELLKKADIISIHVPLNEKTRHFFNEEKFRMMKKNAIIVNVSRGSVIDEKALIKALEHAQLGGAGLDVFEEEPVTNNNPLLKMKNVVVTPHLAWYSEEALQDLQKKVAEEAVRILQGGRPIFSVNAELIKGGN